MVKEETLRRRMVEEQIRRRGIRDERVLAAIEEVPRHLFVPADVRHLAYADDPLPIGGGQTISQPYIVAEMTAALRLSGSDKVLEVGTGTGYQTAILAKLCRSVISVERIASLSADASARLSGLGVDNVVFVVGDGSRGCPEHAPFDRILSAAGAPSVPVPWIEQVTEGGIILLPMGGRRDQELARVTKKGGRPVLERLGGCVFVPLIGEYGFRD